MLYLVGRLAKWYIEMSKFDILFDPRKLLKAQVFADFIVEMTLAGFELASTWHG